MKRFLVIGALAAAGLAVPATAGQADVRRAPEVNLALAGSAAAAGGGDAGAAVDGNAATSWCPAGPSGTVTVDLVRSRRLSGFGVTLLGSVRADVAIATATAPGRFHTVRRASVAAGSPVWFAARTRARWVRLSLAGKGGGTPCLGELRAMGRGPSMIIGHDLSFAVQEKAAGARYTDRGRTAPPERILASHGANYVRLRLWVNPPAGYSDLESVLTMARRAKAAGMKLLLDPHYSDFWADPQKQPIPEVWAGQDLPALAATVRAYTRDVLDRLRAQGTPADMLQLGNEIRNGMLWPAGQIDWSAGTGWDGLGTLLRAAAAGARDAAGPTPTLVVHFDQGGDNAWSRSFFDHIVAQRVPFDVIGLSYYPFWHGTLSDLRANLDDLASRYRRDVAVVETQYGWTLANGDDLGNFLWQESQLVPGYPASPDGQRAFLSDLLSAVAAVPGGRGAGVFYWQPEWIPGVGWAPGEGTPNDNLTLFDFQGRALPSQNFADPASF
ncbi:arabinogalactan endo-1,4-beta-galactosidase [Actinomadura madurae]|uniref:Arabinogalactan endo-beta-1,4-galactanase n=1 Tax=Actinomadura madurae TaxID=1993 RepID=A0A1I5NDA7_9ACTN|nr:glycosyl hydrolase 53 family protein [Actinomadura madurae]SFP19650.1 Glycosyl hydrolase family 53 [Actinomadura madurae]SPT50202.1 Arabinogalactan endo-1,4-beta-galactosidase precursor [Actinomadura madurae]